MIPPSPDDLNILFKKRAAIQEDDDEETESDFTDKLQVCNVGKYKNKKDIQKLMESLNVPFTKIKIAPKWTHCFINFASKTNLSKAKEKLEGHSYKQNVIYTKIMKQQTTREPELKEFKPTAPVDELINNQTIPLWKVDYKDQLVQKQTYIEKHLKSLKNQLRKFFPKKNYNEKIDAVEGESSIDRIKRMTPEQRALDHYIGFIKGLKSKMLFLRR